MGCQGVPLNFQVKNLQSLKLNSFRLTSMSCIETILAMTRGAWVLDGQSYQEEK